MPDPRHILEDDALDFVLKGNRPDQHESTSAAQDEQSATIRGDLARVNLPDIFQTITMSQMQGTLRVQGSQEPTYVHFAGGKIRVLPPNDLQTRRLGYRLLASGLMDAKTIRAAFIRHKREGGDLSEILGQDGRVERVQLQAMRLALEEDFLLELFTLRRGQFAFFKDDYPAAGLEERFKQSVEFETDQVLLEIARRSDEWNFIITKIGDLDEIFVRTGRAEPPGEGDVVDDLFAQIDGKRSLRDIAGGMLDSLFEVSKAAGSLLDLDAIEKAPTQHILVNARSAQAAGNARQAISLLTLLRDNREPTLSEQEEMAELLVAVGDARAGAEVLAAGAGQTEDPQKRLEILQRAKQLDTLNRVVLEMLISTLREFEDGTLDPSFREAALHLIEVYGDGNEFDGALALIAELEGTQPNDLALTARKARILLRMDRKAEAFAQLSELAKVFRQKKDVENLTRTLEQILKLDASDSKTRSELKSLLESKGIRRARQLAILLGCVLLLRVTWGMASGYWREKSGRQRLAEATQLFRDGQVDSSRQIAQEITQEMADTTIATEAWDLLGRIKAQRENEERSKRQAELTALLSSIKAAVEQINKGEYARALKTYADLLAQNVSSLDNVKRIKQSAQTRFLALAQVWREEIDAGESTAIPPVHTATTPELRADLQKKLTANFKDERIHAAEQFKRVLTQQPELRKNDMLPPKLLETLDRYMEVGDSFRERRRHLAGLIAEDEQKARLDPLFIAARKAEDDRDFRQAFLHYSKLTEEYKGDVATLAVFRDKRDLYENVLRELDLLSAATERGDHAEALRRYLLLKEVHPQLPIDAQARLPLRIDSDPTGAAILDGDKVVGQTPFLLSYKPNQELKLSLQLEGYETVVIDASHGREGRFHAVMGMKPARVQKLGGSLTHEPRYVGEGDLLIITDRSATLWGLAVAEGKVRFQRTFRTVSGDLGLPLVVGDRIVLPAREGKVHGLDVATGDPRWSLDVGGVILPQGVGGIGEAWLTREDGQIAVIKTTVGTVERTIHPLGRTRHAPIRDELGRMFCVDLDGKAIALQRGDKLWERTVPQAGWVGPAASERSVLLPTQDGCIIAMAKDTGNQIWKLPLDDGDSVHQPLLVDGARVFAATVRKLLVEIDLAKGEIKRRVALPDVPSAAPALIDGIIFVPVTGRGAIALRTSDLTYHCSIAPGMTSESRVVTAGPDYFVFAATSGNLLFFSRRLLHSR
jgi:outer membrane protein assembly factor BamB